MTRRITLEAGDAALERFRTEMPALGYIIQPFPLYDRLSAKDVIAPAGTTEPKKAGWVKRKLGATYSATALNVRTAPDFLVFNPYADEKHRVWLAEVKEASPDYPNLALEAVQLLTNYNLAMWLGTDIRYVYVPHGSAPLKWQWAMSVCRGGKRVLHSWPSHPSNDYADELLLNLGWKWERRPSQDNYDPFTLVDSAELSRWYPMTTAREEAGDTQTGNTSPAA